MAGASPAHSVAPATGVQPPKICFNSHCKLPLPAPPPQQSQPKKGWRMRSGELADLCDRCSCAYEQGSFCETFHSEIAGWRNCEACGKRIHCGCIASATTYVLLDAGGIECIACARKSLTMVPSQMLASPMHIHQHASDRRDLAAKSWRPLNGPFPGQWRQTPHMWNMTSAQSDLQQRLSYEFDRPSNIEKMIPGGRHSVSAHEKKFEELPDRAASSSLSTVPRDKYVNGNTGGRDPISVRRSIIPESCSTIGAGPTLCVNPQLTLTAKEETTSTQTGLVSPFPLNNGSKDARFPSNQSPSQVSPSARQFYNQGAVDAESHAQMLNGRPRFDGRARVPMLPRYWPRTTDQELQQISGDTNSVITPLFEKMLSASDAGRIGRLVLPKKCAEAYFPTISHPEGLPLKVQDASGKEWVFQFRFWPNNNSRMYVLEGVTPCIQSMQLQAGDTVTFSRIDPEGKLIMGFRKASSTPSEQESQTPQVDNQSPVVDFVANIPLQEAKLNAEPKGTATMPGQASCSMVPTPEFIQKDGPEVKSSHVSFKRKNSTSKARRLKSENNNTMELKVTWEEAQELLRPPPNITPTVIKIEGFEFEEYEQAPVLGKRTYFTTNQAGENSRWVQCEDCSKWRKLPVDVLLPAKWICSDNVQDPDRNTCSSAEEKSFEQLMDLVYSKAGSSKRSKVKVRRESVESDRLGSLASAILGASKRSKANIEREDVELSDGLDTLANLAILGEGGNLLTTSQQTTKHPRHRPGCTCIVCIQPPSGKGPKHKHTCTCNLCLTVRRRFRTLMLRRQKRQLENLDKARKEEKAESSRNQPVLSTVSEQLVKPSPDLSAVTLAVNRSPKTPTSSTVAHEGTDHRRTSPSPLKAPQIDLNIQPEREEEPSPKADTGSLGSLNQNAAT